MTPKQHAKKIVDIMLAKIEGHESMLNRDYKADARATAVGACDVIISELLTVDKANPVISFEPLIIYWKRVKEEIKES